MKAIDALRKEINENGYTQVDTRLNRTVRTLNGGVFRHHYLEFQKPMELAKLPEKYGDDWVRMYPSFVQACAQIKQDPTTRRAMIFNSSGYYTTFECFLMMHVIRRDDGEYEVIIYQRSSDLDKFENDISYFEYVMYKIGKKIEAKVNKLTIFFGSVHYQVNET